MPTKHQAAAPKHDQQLRHQVTGQYAYKLGAFERMCVCGHSLGSHCAGGFDCLVGTGIPQFGTDDNSTTCDCPKFRQSRRNSKSE